MRKYGMLILTLVIVLTTISLYIYQNIGLPAFKYKLPEIKLTSKKYGEILDVKWSPGIQNSIIFLAAAKGGKAGEELSWLYNADLVTGEVKDIYQFPTHNKLKNYLQSTVTEDYIFTASPQGINQVKYNSGKEITSKFHSIENFENAEDVFVWNKIYYTLPGNKLLYVQNMPSEGFTINFNTLVQSSIKTYYKLMDKLIFSLHVNPYLFYTRNERNGLNLYKAELDRNNAGIREKRVISNIVNPGQYPYKDERPACIVEKGEKLAVMLGETIIEEIPNNNDMLGQVPGIEIAQWNDDYIIAYTKFDDKHNGTLVVVTESGKPEEVVKDMPIIGALRVSYHQKKIIFFIKENDLIRMKLYDISSKSVKDISDIVFVTL